MQLAEKKGVVKGSYAQGYETERLFSGARLEPDRTPPKREWLVDGFYKPTSISIQVSRFLRVFHKIFRSKSLIRWLLYVTQTVSVALL